MTAPKRTTPARKRTTTARRRTSTRRSTSTTRRRRIPTVAAGVGTAVGTLVVAGLLRASWPLRIGLVVLALLLVAGWAVWRARSETAAAAPDPEQPA